MAAAMLAAAAAAQSPSICDSVACASCAGAGARAGALRVTEAASPATADLDVAPTPALVRLLAASDAGLCAGWAGLPGLAAPHVLAAAAAAAAAGARARAAAGGRVIFAGCGTSGRLAHFFARSFNAAAAAAAAAAAGGSATTYDYLCAGGDAALLLSQEAFEDRPSAGEEDLAAWERARGGGSAPVVLIGISCGLSATYVGAMLRAALSRPHFTVVAVGFNPVAAVAAVRVDGWADSFHAVLRDMAAVGAPRALIINPVLGPEVVAGSSRMKGGSATKVVVEAVVAVGEALARAPAAVVAAAAADPAALRAQLADLLLQYELAVRAVYAQSPALERLVDAAARSLTAVVPAPQPPVPPRAAGAPSPTGHGRLVYLGVGAAGLLGLIDASECPPTYGCVFNEVRGFVAGGWATVGGKRGAPQRLALPPHLRAPGSPPETVGLGLDSFDADVVPTLGPADTAVLLLLLPPGGDDDAAALDAALASLAAARAAGAAVRHAVAGCAAGERARAALARVRAAAPDGIFVPLPAASLRLTLPLSGGGGLFADGGDGAALVPPPCLAELALKLVLNAATVGAFVRRGTIFRNRMVNVALTNAKLFLRAAGIVADTTAVTPGAATIALLRAIYARDDDAQTAAAAIGHLLPGGGGGAAAGAGAAPAATPDRAAIDAGDFDALAALGAACHVFHASSQRNLVPLAILLAIDAATHGRDRALRMTVAQARALLDKQPVVRRAVLDALQVKRDG